MADPSRGERKAIQKFCGGWNQRKAIENDKRPAIQAAAKRRNVALQTIREEMENTGMTRAQITDTVSAHIVKETRKRGLNDELISAGVTAVPSDVFKRPDVKTITDTVFDHIQRARTVPRTRLVFREGGKGGVALAGGAQTKVRTMYNTYLESRDENKKLCTDRRNAIQEATADIKEAAPTVEGFLQDRELRCQTITLKEGGKDVTHYLRTMKTKRKPPLTVLQLRTLTMVAVQAAYEKLRGAASPAEWQRAIIMELQKRWEERPCHEGDKLVLHRGRQTG